MPKISFRRQTKQLIDETDIIIRKSALGFHSDIVRHWPVALIRGGTSKDGWRKPVKIDGAWVVANNVSYSSILWYGWIPSQTRKGMQGSRQMMMGGSPILNRTIMRMRKDLKAL